MENTDTFAGYFKQAKGQLRQWWGKLTDDDIEQVAGKKDVLIGKLQERYGKTRAEVEQEIDTHFDEYCNKGKTKDGGCCSH